MSILSSEKVFIPTYVPPALKPLAFVIVPPSTRLIGPAMGYLPCRAISSFPSCLRKHRVYHNGEATQVKIPLSLVWLSGCGLTIGVNL